ncbi:hypothetical protein EXIGLDRAFT_841656 [Exidia glandulosa HHB12029]|uniref:F-box domain-containing protein n=1 Tax=Exidia glandulosa HHB12029 TaxID=1314781 RepID=A0A165DQY2_EXIGL|nr:hypothetical protein EXIGLDRAFT_841656 [Exidia glandulosa HHB12029]
MNECCNNLHSCATVSATILRHEVLSRTHTAASHAAAAMNGIIMELQRVLRDRAAKIRVSWSVRAPSLDRMASNILERVIAYLALVDVLALSQTSMALRSFTMGTPGIWSRIRAYPAFPAEQTLRYPECLSIVKYDCPPPIVWKGLLELLRRSLPVPARVALRVDVSRSYDDLANLFTHVFQRSEELTLNLCGPNWGRLVNFDVHPVYRNQCIHGIGAVDSNSWSRVSSMLTTPAANLRTLSLVTQDESLHLQAESTDLILRLPLDFLGGAAPNLRSLSLRGIALPSTIPSALSSLTLFDYEPGPASLTSIDMDVLLRHMPQLRTLGLTLKSFAIDAQNDHQQPSPPSHALLEVFVAITYHISDDHELAQSVLSYFQDVPALHFRLGGHWWSHIPAVADRRNAAVFKMLPSHMQSPEHLTIFERVVTMESRGLHVTQGAWGQFTLRAKFVAFDNLLTLTLDETSWPDSLSGFAPAPNLTHLHILVTTGDVFSCAHGPPWECANLQDLRISCLIPSKTMCAPDCLAVLYVAQSLPTNYRTCRCLHVHLLQPAHRHATFANGHSCWILRHSR